jgi:hypothetical protein
VVNSNRPASLKSAEADSKNRKPVKDAENSTAGFQAAAGLAVKENDGGQVRSSVFS